MPTTPDRARPRQIKIIPREPEILAQDVLRDHLPDEIKYFYNPTLLLTKMRQGNLFTWLSNILDTSAQSLFNEDGSPQAWLQKILRDKLGEGIGNEIIERLTTSPEARQRFAGGVIRLIMDSTPIQSGDFMQHFDTTARFDHKKMDQLIRIPTEENDPRLIGLFAEQIAKHDLSVMPRSFNLLENIRFDPERVRRLAALERAQYREKFKTKIESREAAERHIEAGLAAWTSVMQYNPFTDEPRSFAEPLSTIITTKTAFLTSKPPKKLGTRKHRNHLKKLQKAYQAKQEKETLEKQRLTSLAPKERKKLRKKIDKLTRSIEKYKKGMNSAAVLEHELHLRQEAGLLEADTASLVNIKRAYHALAHKRETIKERLIRPKLLHRNSPWDIYEYEQIIQKKIDAQKADILKLEKKSERKISYDMPVKQQSELDLYKQTLELLNDEYSRHTSHQTVPDLQQRLRKLINMTPALVIQNIYNTLIQTESPLISPQQFRYVLSTLRESLEQGTIESIDRNDATKLTELLAQMDQIEKSTSLSKHQATLPPPPKPAEQPENTLKEPPQEMQQTTTIHPEK